MTIPMIDLPAQWQSLRHELAPAIEKVLAAGAFIGGEETRRFEEEFARYCGVRAACGVGSGTDALYLILRALGIGEGGEVVTTPFTFFATASAITRTGASVAFADVLPDTLNVDPREVEKAIGERTRAIVAVHLYGDPAEMDPLRAIASRHRLALVEDAAQAHGAEYGGRPAGALGAAAAFSFYPTKNLGAAGDAGIVVSDDPGLVETARELSRHGEVGKYEHRSLGINSRLDNVQAAILRVKLKRLESWNRRRAEIVERYRERLRGAPGLVLPGRPRGRSAHHLFTIRLAEREALREHLARAGIASSVHYPRPVHRQEAYRRLGIPEGSFPVAERAAREVLSLPLYPELPDEAVDRISAEVLRFIEERR